MDPPRDHAATGDARFGAAAIAEDLLAVAAGAAGRNITNFVVMQQTANALLAIGASPIMAHAEAELDELVELAGALALNIGTLDPAWIGAMERRRPLPQARAAHRARSGRRGREPVGALERHAAGRSRRGDEPARECVEILALAGAAGATRDRQHHHRRRRATRRGVSWSATDARWS